VILVITSIIISMAPRATPNDSASRGRGAGAERPERRRRAWVDHAQTTLRGAGLRASRPRTAVVEALGRRSCIVTAAQLEEEMRREGRDVGTATVYRTLELLDELGLVQRLDTGEGPAAYEPAGPRGEHHHHVVCNRCARVVPFEDEGLERAIERAERRLAGRIEGHEVTLRGLCGRCAP
jgi:Fur family transcriptional regulator, ferric uptake regulator